MLGKRLKIIPWMLLFVGINSNAVETYVEGEVGYRNPCIEMHGPCPCSACTHWPLIGTDTPLPLPDEPCPSNGWGFLFGLQWGWGNTHWTVTNDNINVNFPNTVLVPDSVTTDGLAVRIYLGYDFGDYFGIEGGYTYLPETDAAAVQTATNGSQSDITGKISNYTIDLLAKFMFPLTDDFGVYAKAGGAYYRSGSSGFIAFTDDTNQEFSLHHIGPAFGLGMFYHIVPYLTADLSWMHYYGNSDVFLSSSNPDAGSQPSPDVFLMGISYKFEQRYLSSI